MIKFSTNDKQQELTEYCQKWLANLSKCDFENAQQLIDIPNCYGVKWGERELKEVVIDYFDQETDVTFQNLDITTCYPEFIESDDGTLLFGFYLPANDELTDLTVQFEFQPNTGMQYLATINDVHVL
ncbi:hypothetical protein WNY81_08630 [Shewanella frigidimarina]|uniref:hypothetical protein n=1 Tax=Shewanella frigidimarina TaxID=56812 RepID=UPI003179656D